MINGRGETPTDDVDSESKFLLPRGPSQNDARSSSMSMSRVAKRDSSTPEKKKGRGKGVKARCILGDLDEELKLE